LIYVKENKDQYKRWTTKHKTTSKNKSTLNVKLVVFFLRPSTACRNLNIALKRQQRKMTPTNTPIKQSFEDRKSQTTERTPVGGILQAM
jgi:hypothetical protein